MINKISVEDNRINSKYYARNNNRDLNKNPSFKGGILPVILQGVQACEQNPMVNVAVIDMFSAILPRTFVESLTNWYAGLEAFRRESSGLIVNCLIPSVITLGIAQLLNKPIMPKGANMAPCWANTNMINKISAIYENSNAQDKVKDSLKTLLGNIEGYDGKQKFAYKDILTEQELETYAQKLKDMSVKDMTRHELAKNVGKLTDELVEKTKIYENIKVNGGKTPVRANTVDALLKDSVRFFREYQKVSDKVTISEFANKSKKLVRSKSLIGLAVVLPLAASMQYINRWITQRTSGVKGAPIYKDFGKENTNEEIYKKNKKGLLKQKIISISSMLTVGLLSMMKMPSWNMLEFKGIFPTMDQARIISTTTFASRMAAADDKNELAEATARDIATFLSLYFLGDYAAKAAATIIQRNTGVRLLNDTKPLDKNAGFLKRAWHWFKDVNVKSSREVVSKTQEMLKSKGLTPDEAQKDIIKKEIKQAKAYRSVCQVANLGVSLALLGLVIPIFIRKNTAKKHEQDLINQSRLTESSDTRETVTTKETVSTAA